jgi:hypothetical protein
MVDKAQLEIDIEQKGREWMGGKQNFSQKQQ